MLRALVWKEWREQRLVFTMGLAVAAGMPLLLGLATVIATGGAIGELSGSAAPDLAATLIWPLLAALFGAGAIGSERVERTLDFLVSRPASLARLWAVKIAIAGGCLLLVMALSAIVLNAFTREPFFVVFLRYWQWAAAAALLVFASSVLVSHRASRPLAAAAMGALVAIATFLVVPVAVSATIGSLLYYRSLLTGVPLTRSIGAFSFAPEQAVGALMAVCSGAYLLLSMWLFARRELRRGVGVGSATFAGVGIVAVCLVSTGPAALAQWSLSPSWGYIDNRTVSPDGEHIVLTVQHYPLSQVWAMPTDGGAMYRLSRRSPAAMNPVFSPDGEWVAYFTEHYGAVGLRYRDPDLWLARADGSSTRLLASDLPRSGPTGPNLQAIFTADSTHVAVLRSMHLCLVATSDGRSRCADLQADLQGRTSPRLIGTSSSGDEIFLVVRGPAMEYRVVGVAAEIGALRTVASLRSVSSPMWLGSVRGETDDYLVALRTGEGRGATSINTSTGETRDIAVCHSGLGIADALYYVACEGPHAGFLVRHDVATGAETRIAAIDPETPAYGTVVPDATGQRIALVTESTESGGARRVFRRGGGTVRVFDRDGTELLSSWWPSEPRVAAWTRDDRLVVAQGMNVRPDGSISWRLTGMLRVIDVQTGTSDPIELGWPR